MLLPKKFHSLISSVIFNQLNHPYPDTFVHISHDNIWSCIPKR